MNVKYLKCGALLLMMLPILMMLPTFAISQSTTATNNQNNAGTRYLGFQNNWGLSVRTDGITRMRINPSGSLFGGSVPTDGYIGIGDNPADIRSRLTITGTNNTFFGGAGYRSWMKTGVFNLENSDNLYVGLKDEGFNRSDAIFAWGDDGGGNALNNARFIFAGTAPVNGSCTNCPTNSSGLNGREVLRMNPNGNIGIGPLFVQNNQPKSTMHLHIENNLSNWLQISNQNLGLTPNLISQSDGLRIGIFGSANNLVNGNAMIYNQENRHLLFSTGSGTGITTPTNTRERMRITAVANPTELPNGNIGNYNPGNINGNRTRVAISHDPANPVTRPLSLLHLGYNTGSFLFPGTTDGWRSWMDVGMFVAQGTDNMYFGLKPEGNDRFDAVINWGDNQNPAGPFQVGPDNLRFVFTSTIAVGSGDPISTSNDGLEVMRMEPQDGQTFQYNNFGMVGIGNFAANGPNTAPADVVDAKLDIDGDLRIRQVNQDDLLERVLVVDPTDHNRVYWRDVNSITANANIQANNGTSLDPNSIDPIVQLGQELVGGTPAYTGIGELLNDREIPMNGQDLIFSSTNAGFTTPGIERIAIGAAPPSAPGTPVFPSLPTSFFNNASSKLQVFNATEQTGAHFVTLMDPLGIGFSPDQYSGAKGTVFADENDKSIIGLLGQGISLTQGTRTEGVRGESFGSGNNVGVSGRSIVTPFTSTGGEFTSRSVDGICLPGTSVGVRGRATGSNTSNIAILGEVDNGNPCNAAENYAGFFNGDVFVNGTLTQASDENLKSNIQNIQGTDALNIIRNLNPVSFEYDNSINERMMLPDGIQYGFVAQDVEQVLPAIVHTTTLPAEFDSLGNEISPAFEFLSLESQDLIPLLLAAAQEQSQTVDSLSNELAQKDSLLNDVNDRLTQLENCLSNLLPLLCQINNSAIQQNDEETQEALLHQINVELFDGENIILEQNIPNPFAERTVINFSIPASVGEAKLLFYNNQGRMIRTVKINERGAGQVNVFGAELSKGTYSYTLICDGEVISTKKMVKQ
ncbi:MAG: hypothetical protein COA32_00375 [Fluviicola sp.]|nr:MAG: hypothetical protein COA32_00375 [Fluviicola sp.]